MRMPWTEVYTDSLSSVRSHGLGMGLQVRRRLLKWGNGYGIRLTHADVEKLGLRAGDEVDAHLGRAPIFNDTSKLTTFDSGIDWSKADMDELAAEGAGERPGY